MQTDRDGVFIADLKLASASSDGSVVVSSVPVTLVQHRISMKSKARKIVFRMRDITCASSIAGNSGGLSSHNEKSGRICTVAFTTSQLYMTEKEVPSSVALPSLGIYAVDSIQPCVHSQFSCDANSDAESKISHDTTSQILLYGGSTGLIRMHSL